MNAKYEEKMRRGKDAALDGKRNHFRILKETFSLCRKKKKAPEDGEHLVRYLFIKIWIGHLNCR